MKARLPGVWMVLGVAVMLSGCMGGASPPTRFFLLTAVEGARGAAGTSVRRGPVVELEPVEIPRYLDRAEMVTRTGGNRLQLDRLHQWGGDLREDIGRVLAENLSALLASDRVVLLPTRGEGRADYRLAVTLSRFEPDAISGEVLLDARWILFDGRGREVETRQARLVTRAGNREDFESLAVAMSEALGLLSRQLGESIRARPAS
ncbi:MAG: membrane integrity-associated transporter subunit PqiC [Magnetococcales bacterium]|nr:membrane integrity-associated transporter subunit PqiC [Magnetococcales bacterium]